MINKKPALEKLTPSFGSSILVKQHQEKADRLNAFWHFHPELELIFVHKGQGRTHIGNHLSYFNNSQLILIGSNLPHNGFADRLTANGTETMVLKFLEILDHLGKTDDYTLLNADGIALETNPQDSDKINIIYKYVNANFKQHITLDEIAEKVSMTVPAFCRYFKKTTGKTFTQLVNEYL